ncbi:PREDICTED: uncharacterized protein LOC104805340 [Tarenaya hassleriana]|uniref:uncharacterized protein LOC104805340 n=1 Tax=Tarenaya hassleriana TaxID=28532 RepID=UPI00053C6607|nr:PREDICTED: uncharacterized protein LOC104805340 [Tarenaya hassleriana]
MLPYPNQNLICPTGVRERERDFYMDGGDRWPATSAPYNRKVIGNILQRFRPIAPKPVVGGCLNKTDDEAIGGTRISIGRNRRFKRKYVRVRKDNNNHSNSNRYYKVEMTRAQTADLCKDAGSDGSGSHRDIVTLQLLPEKGDDLGTREAVFNFTDSTGKYCKANNTYGDPLPGENYTVMSLSQSRRTVADSWVTVECVTGTCTDEAIRSQLGRTDTERVRHLEGDTCPGFVSDGSNRVRWVNGSYRRMMGVTGEEDVRVWVLVTVDQMGEMACMGDIYGAVTCRVRVRCESTWHEEKSRSVVKMAVPCDVWKMGSGGFAWRLDVEAALCLGR